MKSRFDTYLFYLHILKSERAGFLKWQVEVAPLVVRRNSKHEGEVEIEQCTQRGVSEKQTNPLGESKQNQPTQREREQEQT